VAQVGAEGRARAGRMHSIPASTQLGAVAWLRWRMFANNFRRTGSGSRSVGGIILAIVVRLFLWPILAVWVVGPVIGAGYVGWMPIH
jgi:nitrate reductase NapE component